MSGVKKYSQTRGRGRFGATKLQAKWRLQGDYLQERAWTEGTDEETRRCPRVQQRTRSGETVNRSYAVRASLQEALKGLGGWDGPSDYTRNELPYEVKVALDPVRMKNRSKSRKGEED